MVSASLALGPESDEFLSDRCCTMSTVSVFRIFELKYLLLPLSRSAFRTSQLGVKYIRHFGALEVAS